MGNIDNEKIELYRQIAQLLEAQKALIERLTIFENNVRTITADHEARLRSLEQNLYRFLGAIALLALIFSGVKAL